MPDYLDYFAELYGDEVVKHELACLDLTFLKRKISFSGFTAESGVATVTLGPHGLGLSVGVVELSDAMSPLNFSMADHIEFMSATEAEAGHRVLQALFPDIPINFYEVDEADAAEAAEALKDFEEVEEFDYGVQPEELEDWEDLDELENANIESYCGLVFFEGFTAFIGLTCDPAELESFALRDDIADLIQVHLKRPIKPV